MKERFKNKIERYCDALRDDDIATAIIGCIVVVLDVYFIAISLNVLVKLSGLYAAGVAVEGLMIYHILVIGILLAAGIYAVRAIVKSIKKYRNKTNK